MVAGRGGSETQVWAPSAAGPLIPPLRGCSFPPDLTPPQGLGHRRTSSFLQGACGQPLASLSVLSPNPRHHLLWPKHHLTLPSALHSPSHPFLTLLLGAPPGFFLGPGHSLLRCTPAFAPPPPGTFTWLLRVSQRGTPLLALLSCACGFFVCGDGAAAAAGCCVDRQLLFPSSSVN